MYIASRQPRLLAEICAEKNEVRKQFLIFNFYAYIHAWTIALGSMLIDVHIHFQQCLCTVYRPNKSMIHALYSKVQLFDPSGVPLQAETLSSLVLLHVLNLKIHNQDPIPPCKVLHAI